MAYSLQNQKYYHSIFARKSYYPPLVHVHYTCQSRSASLGAGLWKKKFTPNF